LKKIGLQTINLENTNIENPNYANENDTITITFKEDCDETINIDLNKIKVILNETGIAEENNPNYSLNMVTKNEDEVVLTVKGIKEEGKLSIILEQGTLKSESAQENETIILDSETNLGTEENPFKLDIEIDNTKPIIEIGNVELQRG